MPSGLRHILIPPVGPWTLFLHTERIQVERYQTIFSPQQIVSYLSDCYVTVSQCFSLFKEMMILILTVQTTSPSGVYTQRMMISSLSLSLSLSHNDTQTDTRSVPIGRTVARERCLLNVDRICCLVHFRHENNCRIWIFITGRLFMWKLYSGNISKRWRSSSCVTRPHPLPPPPLLCWILHQIITHAIAYH